MSEENKIEDLTKAQGLLKEASKDLEAKDKELADANTKVSELEKALADKDVEFGKVKEKLNKLEKDVQDAKLSAHVDLMKKAGQLKEDASKADVEKLMDDLRELNDKGLEREAALLKKMAEMNEEDAEEASEEEDKEDLKKTEKKQARKSSVSKLQESDKDKKFAAFCKEIGADDLLDKE